MKNNMQILDDEAVHGFFELSYTQYLVIPRTALQSMPPEWQRRFVKCMEELDEAIDWRPRCGTTYEVNLRHDASGKFMHDPLMDYERGRRKLPLKLKK
jgi:hypothetical protein